MYLVDFISNERLLFFKNISLILQAKWSGEHTKGPKASGGGGGVSNGSGGSVNVSLVLAILEELDSYSFERMDPNSLEGLYSRLFPKEHGKK